MLPDKNYLLRLSQGQLNTLERCPRLFQHTCLEQLQSPADPGYEEKQLLGSRFHLLMQQREMGLPIDSFLFADANLQSWMAKFAEAAPEILKPSTTEAFRESEHFRTFNFSDYLLTVVYDLLIADNVQAQILDWKTSSKSPNKRKLEKNWQTKLYLYLLAETSQYIPENISMTYWFVQAEGKPQNVKFSYSTAQHEQTKKKLIKLLNQLTQWLQDYYQGKPFPQVSEGNKACDDCQFAKRCGREYRVATPPENRVLHNFPNEYSIVSDDMPQNSPLVLDSNLLDLVTIEEVIL